MYGGFLKCGYPQMISILSNSSFHSKPSIFWVPI